MIRTLAVNADNDPVIDEAGNLTMATGEQAIDFIAKHFVKALFGEMIFKADRGMPIFSTALGVESNLAQFEAAFRARMREINQVISVPEFSASIRDDVLYYSAVIETQYGLMQLAGDTLGGWLVAYNYITDRGVIVPDTADVLEQVQGEWREAFGSDLSLEPETPQGMIIAMEARSRAEAARSQAAFANQQMNPDIAQGIFLDAIWAAFGGKRRAATRSTLSGVVFSGVPGTIINAGSIAQTGAGARFRTVSTLIIGQSGSVVGDMEAVETGPIEAAPGSLNQVATTILGWEQVHNPSAATLGRKQETDVQARRRRRNTLALQTISVNEAIISRVYSLEGVESLSYRENESSEPQVIDGIPMIPHSVYLCIDGGDDTQIAEALKATKTLGAGFNGSVEVTIVDSISGQDYTVKFDRPEEINLFVRVTVRASTLNAQSIIPDALMEANAGNIEGADPLAVGVDVSPFEFAAAINFVEPRLVVLGVELSADGVTWQSTPWPVGLDQVVRISRSAIQVNVV